MTGFLTRLRERRAAAVRRLPRWWNRALAGALIVFGIVLPFFFPADSGFMNGTIIAVAYAVMSLGLNIVVGFAGLLDLGYVAFYALGAYSLGWFGSGFFFKLHIHVLVSPLESTLAGIHLKFVLILIAAAPLLLLTYVLPQTDGLARLDWSVPDGTQAVILELGANDMLRGIKPEETRQALDEILKRLTGRRIVVLLCGMRAAPNLGPDYGQAFERVYPDLAEKYHVPLYPFLLDGVALDEKLNQGDGLHPNAAGVMVMVGRMAPMVEALLKGGGEG